MLETRKQENVSILYLSNVCCRIQPLHWADRNLQRIRTIFQFHTAIFLKSVKSWAQFSTGDPYPHLDATAAVTQDVAGAVLWVLNPHRGILRGSGTLVILDTLAPDTRQNAENLR